MNTYMDQKLFLKTAEIDRLYRNPYYSKHIIMILKQK